MALVMGLWRQRSSQLDVNVAELLPRFAINFRTDNPRTTLSS